MSTIVAAADAAHLLRLVPLLLGYTPSQSLVMIPLHESRSLGAMRVDLPPDGADLDAVASTIIGLVCRVDHVEGVVAVVYTAESSVSGLPGGDLIAALHRSAAACGLDVVDALTVAADSWGSHLDPTLPRGGHPLAVIERHAPSIDQSSGADLPLLDAAEVAGVAAALTSLESALTVLCGIPSTIGTEARIDPAALQAACALDDLPALYEQMLEWDAATIDPMRVAVLGWCLSRPSLRDVAIVQWSGDHGRGDVALDAQRRWEDGEEYPVDLAEVLWGEGPRPDPGRLLTALELVRQTAARLPADERAGACATAGWLAWAVGRSTHAGRYAAAALEIDPRLGLAEIVMSFVQSSHLPDWAFRR
ncbi:DUF4192 family protein [Microbacterium oleivorans]|uniref:DUF4192 family protein n=1 Tax=Microbacterium oleivorans TaxID=273677 RepID=UPI00203C947E|nr:DUF4192 family protein [Microbacterium oleivorans]MCM3695228.1 DUF4192 domain-containing protein [Microbacterium oleivorans]